MGHPLHRGIKFIAPVHEEVWGTVRYERLPFLCFYRGHIDHILKNMPKRSRVPTEDKVNLGYGTWLGANIEKSGLQASDTVKVLCNGNK